LLCTAKPRQQKTVQTRVVEDLFAESQTSAPVEKIGKTEPLPRADTSNDDNIFAGTLSSLSLMTKSKAGISKPAMVTVHEDIFAAAPPASAAKTTRRTLQSKKKASDVTNAFNIDNDDDDDIFAVKPSSISSVKNAVAATGISTQKVCHSDFYAALTVSYLCYVACECWKISISMYIRNT